MSHGNNALNLWSESWTPVSEFRRGFDRIFDDWATPPSRGVKSEYSFFPPCDVEERGDHYLLSLEVPGMKIEDFKIEVEKDQLRISGERRNNADQKSAVSEANSGAKNGQRYSERRYGTFQRTFTLASGINSEKVEATYQDGILFLTVPKAESAKLRQVKVTQA